MRAAKTASEMGKMIKFYRQKKGLTQGELARKCKMTQVTISNIEHGAGGTFGALEKIMRALDLEMNFQQASKIDTSDLSKYLET